MNAIDWLLENETPGVRYLAMRDVLDYLPDDPQLATARAEAHRQGPIAAVLDAMHPQGYWEEPGPGYLPKYTSTVWSIILLSQLGASIAEDERIARACAYLLEHALTPYGQFSMSGSPGSTLDCLQGNLLTALLDLGYQDPRLELAYEWMARTVTGEGVAPVGERNNPLRYYAGKCGPRFACGANNRLPCAWGATKVMLAFTRLPPERRTPLIENAILQGIEFFFSVDPVTAQYPSGYAERPSGNWWKFGFPVFYVTDLLQVAEALVGLGLGSDPCLEGLLDLIRGKADPQGRWLLEYDYKGKAWVDFGSKKQPNPWVTLRAMRALKER